MLVRGLLSQDEWSSRHRSTVQNAGESGKLLEFVDVVWVQEETKGPKVVLQLEKSSKDRRMTFSGLGGPRSAHLDLLNETRLRIF